MSNSFIPVPDLINRMASYAIDELPAIHALTDC